MQNRDGRIKEAFHNFYHEAGINCAIGTLMLLSEFYDLELDSQVVNAATGLHGAGKYGAQCGLLEGGLMFIGIYGKHHDLKKTEIVNLCYDWAKTFEDGMGSLVCKGLRPYPFTSEDATKHLCEPISVKALNIAVRFMDERLVPLMRE